MIGQAVARTLLVITLIVTAHALKPFSFKNVTNHFLHSARSLAFFLLDSARTNFDHANQLAMTFSNSVFENGQSGLRWQRNSSAGAEVVMRSAELSSVTKDIAQN